MEITLISAYRRLAGRPRRFGDLAVDFGATCDGDGIASHVSVDFRVVSNDDVTVSFDISVDRSVRADAHRAAGDDVSVDLDSGRTLHERASALADEETLSAARSIAGPDAGEEYDRDDGDDDDGEDDDDDDDGDDNDDID